MDHQSICSFPTSPFLSGLSLLICELRQSEGMSQAPLDLTLVLALL